MAQLDELNAILLELHDLLLGEETLDTALRRVADMAVLAVPACDSCGVSLHREDGRLATRVATDEFASLIDDIQYGLGVGPCLDAVAQSEPIRVPNTGTESRWQPFSEQAHGAGVVSSLSMPLVVRDKAVGALNLYSRRTPFSETDDDLASTFSRQAAVVLINAATYQKTRDVVDQLNHALESRDVIGQAKGILMATERISADEAFDRLRRRSQRSNVKLRDVAKQVVDDATSPH